MKKSRPATASKLFTARAPIDALGDAERKRLLAGQEFLANRVEGISQEMQREFEALWDDLVSDFSKEHSICVVAKLIRYNLIST